MIQCYKCGTCSNDNMNFCPCCGNNLKTQSPQMIIYPCPICNSPNAYNADFCPKCGYQYYNEYNKKRKINIFAIIGSLLYGTSIFLPIISGSFWGTSVSKTLIEGGTDLLFILVIALLALDFSIVGKNLINIIVGFVGICFSIIEVSYVLDIIKESEYGNFYSVGIGIYVMFIGSIIIFIGSMIGLYNEK